MRMCAEFERCADFLARMIEKYVDEISLPNTADVCDAHSKNNDNISNDKSEGSPERGTLSA